MTRSNHDTAVVVVVVVVLVLVVVAVVVVVSGWGRGGVRVGAMCYLSPFSLDSGQRSTMSMIRSVETHSHTWSDRNPDRKEGLL